MAIDDSDRPSGILAVWNDRREADAGFYERWYQGEHLPERLAVTGFVRGRRYEAVTAEPQFFTYYEVSSPQVLISPEYLARLNDPTAATRRIMTEIFQNMNRTVCRREKIIGRMRGSHALTACFADARPGAGLTDWLDSLPGRSGVARAEWWVADQAGARTDSVEQALRGKADAQVGACLFAEGLREADARMLAGEIEQLCRSLAPAAGAQPRIGIYRLIAELANHA
ncbi:MAG: hypothetical protein R3E83_21785 [Burkholderiaceae bacterium]